MVALLAAAVAGCGGSDSVTPERKGQPAAGDYLAKADAACVEWVNLPRSDASVAARTDTEGSRRDHIRMMDWYARAARTATPGAQPPSDRFRQMLHEPAGRMVRSAEQARRELRDGAAIRAIPYDVGREYYEFEQALIDAAADLGLDRCVEEQLEVDEQQTEFRQAANDLCEKAGPRLERAAPDSAAAPPDEYVPYQRELRRVLRRLDAIEPPARERPLWQTGVTGLRVLTRELDALMDLSRKLLAGGGDASVGDRVNRAIRRVDRFQRSARRGFRALAFDECAGLF